MKQRHYLDHAATSPLRPAVKEAMTAAFDRFGNPSSVHAEGRAARAAIAAARQRVLEAIGAPEEGALVFTSGATEANAAALAGIDAATLTAERVILASAVEHPSILAQPGVETLAVDALGRVDLEALAGRLAKGGVALLALMLVNNETGVRQPVEAAARLARQAGVPVHVDAVQALGKLELDVLALGADSIALSAHKIGGPKGVGALWLRQPARCRPLLKGGAQEGRQRAGTENTAGIVGFAAAVDAIAAAEAARLQSLRDWLEDSVTAEIAAARIIAREAARAPHVTALALPGIDAATQVIALDLDGIAVSAGAACSSGKVAASHVLEAMGLPADIAGSTIRVSLGWNTTEADLAGFLEAWRRLANRHRARAA